MAVPGAKPTPGTPRVPQRAFTRAPASGRSLTRAPRRTGTGAEEAEGAEGTEGSGKKNGPVRGGETDRPEGGFPP